MTAAPFDYYETRTQAWIDGLKREMEREVAREVLGLPGGSMAVAWVAVELHRVRLDLEHHANAMNGSWGFGGLGLKQILTMALGLGVTLGGALGGAVAVLTGNGLF